MTGLEGFRPFLEAGIYDVIMPDVKYAGGLRELLRIGEFAAGLGVACSPHNPSGPIAHAHSLHLSAHLPSWASDTSLALYLLSSLPQEDGRLPLE